jgi:hypothetical protein
LRREARKFLGYFVWKITILRQKIIFFPIAKGGAKIFGVFRVKNHDFTQINYIFSNFRGGARRVRPPLDPPLVWAQQLLSTHHVLLKCMYQPVMYMCGFDIWFLNYSVDVYVFHFILLYDYKYFFYLIG